MWECQLEVLEFVGGNLGNALWTGTPGNRWRKHQREEYIRPSQYGTTVEAIEFKQNKRKERNQQIDDLNCADTHWVS